MAWNIDDGVVLVRRRQDRSAPGAGLSEYWRRNRSDREATELALALGALRKVAGHIGSTVRPVHWKGLTDGEVASILLDPEPLRGRYPLSSRTMDRLVGEVVREAFRDVEWSAWVEAEAAQRAGAARGKRAEFLDGLTGAAEDIFLDGLVQGRVWAAYLRTYWLQRAGELDRRDPSLPPAPRSLANAWRNRVCLGSAPENFHPYYGEMLAPLDGFVPALRHLAGERAGPARRRARIEVYAALRARAAEVMAEWDGYDLADDAVGLLDDAGPRAGTFGGDDAPEAEREKPERQGRPPADLADQVKALLGEGTRDLSASMKALAAPHEGALLETAYSAASAPCTVAPEPGLVASLRTVFALHAAQGRLRRKRLTLRGLDSGGLDARRLHRAPVDGRVFKERRAGGPEAAWSIAVVADASASMGRKAAYGTPWRVAEQAFASLAAAAAGYDNRIEVYAYYEQKGRCEIVSLLRGSCLGTVCPTGQTPSGEAVLAAAALMKKDRRNRLIVHLTDGQTNCGAGLGAAADYCRSNAIEVLTVAVADTAETRTALRELYGRGLCLIGSVLELAGKLESVLRERLLGKGA